MPSDLASKLAHFFPPGIRNRGQVYYRQGAVRIRNGSPNRVKAQVVGSGRYEVELDWENGILDVFCTCPYFDSDGLCKHLWAVVVASDSCGYLSAATTVREVRYADEDDGDDDDFDSALWTVRSRPVPQLVPPRTTPPPLPAWKARIADVGRETIPTAREWPAKREILYMVELQSSLASGQPVFSFVTRERRKNGDFSKPVPLRLDRRDIPGLPRAEDREILSAISGASEYHPYYASGGVYGPVPQSATPGPALCDILLPPMVRTGRCYLRKNVVDPEPALLAWDEGGPWKLELRLTERTSAHKRDTWLLGGCFCRGEDRMAISDPSLVTRGYVFGNGRATPVAVAPLSADTPMNWLVHLRRGGPIEAPEEDVDELLSTLLCTPGVPEVRVPEALRYEDVALAPRPVLQVRPARNQAVDSRLSATLLFDYGGKTAGESDRSAGFYDTSERRLTRRDPEAEKAARNLLEETGFRFRPPDYHEKQPLWELPAAKLPKAVSALIGAGWHVEVDGKVFRRAGAFRLSVSSGLDWFELHGDVDFGPASARIPELLAALRSGKKTVRLDDGTFGILPEEWLQRIGMLAGMGTAEDGHLRFRKNQAGLLDALLAAQPEATFDAGFARVRAEMESFRSVEPAPQPTGFVGQLRDYQREGLGWMNFLRRFSFGGCLADDMGVGKTAQVLAMLESRRELKERGESLGPSLVVVPRSLLFNWLREAERFTPQLRVLDHSGTERDATLFSDYDLILVTYGTLRRDIAELKDVAFDYVVLDEAQAVKNAATDSARAVRLLRGEHRLALSGTPVENHIGELWSLFEFLNPGLLGAASVFKLATASGRTVEEETRTMLSSALRPFILRRTKDQVAKELPAKTEQTIYCELAAPQRKMYDELRRHYRDGLLKRVAEEGMGKAKIMVLEALLRLRQAACHPGLIDKKRTGETSAKLEALEEQLAEVLDSGHKALVFSQFTSLLAILRGRLDSKGVAYEYLDGKTRDRQAHVDRFQNDPACGLFLISLKAGGLGLNLTAADYVFLLDPWWNPAVEAQAVDRAHRIGQQRKVFAYRLIARDTVEEKVLELQKTKRDLAAAIIGQDNALIKNLRREDLELLLS